MNYIPTQSDLLEMSLHSFAEHAEELLAKHNAMTEAQRIELAEIGRKLVNEPVR